MDSSFKLLLKGIIATQIREVHCIIFTDLIVQEKLNKFNTEELVSIFSCFTNVSVNENLRAVTPSKTNTDVYEIINNITNEYNNIKDLENHLEINTGTDCHMQYDMIEYSLNWCNCENALDCKLLLQKIETEKEIFLGEFVKALLKINNISAELEKVAENIGNIELLHKLKEIPKKTLKYVATNQSLYI
jgi:superfamily II RNA helicase